MKQYRVGIVGATGMVGYTYIYFIRQSPLVSRYGFTGFGKQRR